MYVHILCVSVIVDIVAPSFSCVSLTPPLSVNKERSDIPCLYRQPVFVPDGLLALLTFMGHSTVYVYMCCVS